MQRPQTRAWERPNTSNSAYGAHARPVTTGQGPQRIGAFGGFPVLGQQQQQVRPPSTMSYGGGAGGPSIFHRSYTPQAHSARFAGGSQPAAPSYGGSRPPAFGMGGGAPAAAPAAASHRPDTRGLTGYPPPSRGQLAFHARQNGAGGAYGLEPRARPVLRSNEFSPFMQQQQQAAAAQQQAAAQQGQTQPQRHQQPGQLAAAPAAQQQSAVARAMQPEQPPPTPGSVRSLHSAAGSPVGSLREPPRTASGRGVWAAAKPPPSAQGAPAPAPPGTPGPTLRMTVAGRSLQGTYPGKKANQDSYLMQPLQPLLSTGRAAATNGTGVLIPEAPSTPMLAAGVNTAGRQAYGQPPPTAERPPPSQGGGTARGRPGLGPDLELMCQAGGDAIIGVYDGHGQHGHHVSRFVKDKLAQELARLGGSELSDGQAAERELALAHHRTNEALKRSGIDVSLSGSTACTALKRGRRLLVANVGDSRAVLGQLDPATGRLMARDLSIDHKPDATNERARIEGNGGKVHPSIMPGAGYVGPARVWDPTQRFGLATSRSMGDSAYYGPNRSGVIAEPEITSHRLDTRDKFVILGSDGVWDRLSSQEAVEIVRRCKDVEHASDQITQVARARWKQTSPMTDDITAVVVGLS